MLGFSLFLVDSVRVWFTSLCVRALMPAMSTKPLRIFPHAYVSTWSVMGPLTSLDILYKILSNAAFYVLMIILAS